MTSRDSDSEQLLVLVHGVCLDGHLFEFSVHGSAGKRLRWFHGNKPGMRVEGNVEGVGSHLLQRE